MEVRFVTNFNDDAVFGIIYNQLKEEFSSVVNLPVQELPPQIRKADPRLTYIPHYRLINNFNPNVLIQIGPKVFSIAVVNEYPGWVIFNSYIKKYLSKLKESQIVQVVNRFSLRYMNFFPNKNILQNSELKIQLSDQMLNSLNCNLKVELQDQEFLNVLQVSSVATRQYGDTIENGSIIDIDTSCEKQMTGFLDDFESQMKRCHDIEKNLFFKVVSSDYLKSLNEVTYDS
jgi:uncharacterized protein (TIGR04255 family)